ncbi:MAG TPA: TIGR02530 family flagellar biosynthesis protein [bacterium]|jgi:flagellar operon protein
MIDAIKRLPPLPGAQGIDPARRTPAPGVSETRQGPEFGDIFRDKLATGEPLTFSAHAQSRLMTRSIHLTAPQMERLQHGVNQAAQKGARESLVVMDNLAFIVSVPNRTVVTAVDGAATNGNVFTQIDSAVIV